MGYFNIIDSLKNSRIEEGMMTSIWANKSFVDKSVLSALVVGDYSLLPKKDVKIIGDSDFFNKSPIKYVTKLVQLVSIDMLDIANHKVRFLSYGVGNVKYIVIMYLNVTAKSSFGRCTIYECKDLSRYGDLVSDANSGGRLFRYLDKDIDGCTIVAKTFFSHIGGSYCYYMGFDDFLEDFILDCSNNIKSVCHTFDKDMSVFNIVKSTLEYTSGAYEFSFKLFVDKKDKDGYKQLLDYLADNINSDGFRAYKVDKSTMEISFFL